MPSAPVFKNITSATNPAVKNVIRLRDRQARNVARLTIVEGVREMTIAMEAGVTFQEVWICPELVKDREGKEFLSRLEGERATVYHVSEAVFGRIAFGDRHEGVLALARLPSRNLSDLSLGKNPLVLAVEKVEKPGNLGAILRSADAAGVSLVLVCEAVTDIYNPNVVRASLSAVFCIPVVQCTNADAAKFFKDKNLRVVAANPAAKQEYANSDLRGPLAIVLGSEQSGLSDFWKGPGIQQVKIPMAGRVDSLNVSTTAAILVFEALRQRTADSG